MTREQNIKAILECNFTGFKDEIIEIATKNIMLLKDQPSEDTFDKIKAEIAGRKQKINFKGLSDYEKAQVETRLSTLNEVLEIIDECRK